MKPSNNIFINLLSLSGLIFLGLVIFTICVFIIYITDDGVYGILYWFSDVTEPMAIVDLYIIFLAVLNHFLFSKIKIRFKFLNNEFYKFFFRTGIIFAIINIYLRYWQDISYYFQRLYHV